MSQRLFLAVAGLGGAVCVAADATATHLLADPQRLAFAATAARYGLIHAVALLAVGLLIARGNAAWLTLAGWLFVAGIVLFCGSLDLLAMGAPHGFAIAAPWGGTAFILGWLAVLIAALRGKS